MKSFEIGVMSPSDLREVIGWAAAEGWNPGLHDAEAFFAADPEGFFLGKLDGDPVAAVSAVRYGKDFGFIGLYIVKPGSRDHGLGGRLLHRASEHLAGCGSVGLDGVENQQANYARHGARHAHSNIRFRGEGPGENPSGSDFGVVSLNSLPWEEIARFDRLHFPAERPSFLKSWIALAGKGALGVVNDGRLTACGVRRECLQGHKIGPLFAESPEVAAQLLAVLRQGVGRDEPFFLDVPEPNHHAGNLVKSLGMTPVFQTARMYLGKAPDLPLERIYGITSFELG